VVVLALAPHVFVLHRHLVVRAFFRFHNLGSGCLELLLLPFTFIGKNFCAVVPLGARTRPLIGWPATRTSRIDFVRWTWRVVKPKGRHTPLWR
jgi:hypothetical protein